MGNSDERKISTRFIQFGLYNVILMMWIFGLDQHHESSPLQLFSHVLTSVDLLVNAHKCKPLVMNTFIHHEGSKENTMAKEK